MTLVIPKALAWVLGAILVIGVSVGAGILIGQTGSREVAVASAEPTATQTPASASPTSTPTATATATATPVVTVAPTAAPTVAATPTAARTPTRVIFEKADGGNGETKNRHTGIFGLVLADATASVNANARRMEAKAWVPTIGSLEKPSARAWLYNDFRAPPGTGTIQAQIIGSIRWLGTLAGNGVLGTSAGVSIDVNLYEGTRIVATQTVHELEVSDAFVSSGGREDEGQKNFAFAATLTAGGLYRVQLEVTCDARTGAIASVTHCIYGPSDVFADGFVEWMILYVQF